MLSGATGSSQSYLAHNADILARASQTEPVEAFLAPLLPARPTVLDWGGDTGAHTPFHAAGGSIWIHDVSGQPLIDGAQQVGKERLAWLSPTISSFLAVRPRTACPGREPMLDEIRDGDVARQTILYVEVPLEALIAENSAVRNLAIRKKHWHEHVNFFTEVAMRRLLARSGMRSLSIFNCAIALQTTPISARSGALCHAASRVSRRSARDDLLAGIVEANADHRAADVENPALV